ncbi:hypothetical protein CQA66_08395 [Helicobacter aurati]|uniref:Uncharacterized protein n=1 Tax=Helicobacter aurati TaxID=137778 RepID=A0A3D8IYS3_9HELI|nr:hypothetical protein [Helicobacter aurati]RDU70418.1 hypothetical protein CQA66_08395 [Helicobacter aurati]
MINKALYFFLKDKVKDYQLRYPYQESPIDLRNGYISWQFVNSNILSTQSKTKQYVNNVLQDSLYQHFINQYMIISEKINTLNHTPFELLSEINIHLNSDNFIHFCRNNNFNLEVLRIVDTLTNDTYLHENKQWITRATMTVNFVILGRVDISNIEIGNIKIDTDFI